jgi:UDP-N-acetylmuramate--alanine ligase
MNYSSSVLPEPPAKIYLVGIKGQAMTALAQLLQSHGYIVVGSDVAETFPTDAVLRRLNIHVASEFSAENIVKDISLVVYSTAYNATHVELQQAAKLGIPILPQPMIQKELLAMANKRVCVSGTHGKTTTSAMLARLLEDSNLNPTALIGSPVSGWNTSARVGGDDIFVLEADEYQNKFQYYDPTHLIVTSVDFDHPDFFPTKVEYQQVFKDFVSKLPNDGYLLLFNEDVEAEALGNLTKAKVETYGLKHGSDWLIANIKYENESMKFEILRHGESLGIFELGFNGVHYALDATAAIAMALTLGAKIENCKSSLRSFRGTARRQEKIGTYNGALIYDDYAHHPSEITPNLKAFRDAYPTRRLVVVFEAHTFTRTEALLSDFSHALAQADVLFITPIFASAREERGTIDEVKFAEAVNAVGGHAVPVSNFEEAVISLQKTVQPNDLVVTMGAGDVWQIAKKLVQNV